MKFTLQFFLLITIVTLGTWACSNDRTEEPVPTPTTAEVWDGPEISFEKANNADPSDAANQDRITDNVWLTRDSEGGQIYNAKSENGSSKESSPAGTLWAVGSLDNVDNLTFTTFRDAVDKPKNVVGKNLVLFLEADEIFLSVTFTSWSTQKGGGFAYNRSTK